MSIREFDVKQLNLVIFIPILQKLQAQQALQRLRLNMIKSLYEINNALVNLSHELSNKQTSNQKIKDCIQKLLSEVRYLDEGEKCHYYFLISQIYASRFQNVEEAVQQLKQFDTSLDMQISMNCQLRVAFYKYFQQNYTEAYKHLDTALSYVEQQLKLIDNAKFFFNRAVNKDYLMAQAKEKHNFQAVFILSLIYQQQNQEIQALKQIEGFLNESNQNFRKFQIYKRLLELYESMRQNSISTISLSKKALQTYRQEMSHLDTKYPLYGEDYQLKSRFVMRIVNFMKNQDSRNKEKLQRKMLDLKLLAYYKLKKCSKMAPNKQIKMTLHDTAKIIKSSKGTQLLESTLNYDFVTKQYQKFKIFYKLGSREELSKWNFFNAFCKYNLKKQPMIHTFNPQSNLKSQVSIARQNPPSDIHQNPSSKLSVNPYRSILKTPSQSVMRTPPQSVIKQTVMKETQSQIMDTSQFEGSNMYKINASSQGYEERYFYLKLDNIKQKPRIYYCNSKKQKSSNDNYYSLKGLQKVSKGKHTPALKRKDVSKFNVEQCFALMFQNGKDRSFYVPDQDHYHRWVILLQIKLLHSDNNASKMSSTVGFYKKASKAYVQDGQQSSVKRSRKVVQI